jgi:hypothetical protein
VKEWKNTQKTAKIQSAFSEVMENKKYTKKYEHKISKYKIPQKKLAREPTPCSF